MGLDMFLTLKRKGKDDEEVGYWRKANAIHQWFVVHVQGGVDECLKYEVSKAQLEELKTTCEKAIDVPDLAEVMLPTQSGFFFGNVDYGEYYVGCLTSTIDICNRAIKLLEEIPAEEKPRIVYQSSW